MSSNTENTEAKLAAYIDGQLDPAERAHLEQYLLANPDSQKLLTELIAQRALLRSLPRDRAPSDIYDAIQAQLERSVLLDDSAHSAPIPIRHSRKSQLVALAAILLLAVGLGVVLYFALPSSKPNPVEVASTSMPAARSDTATLATTEEADDKSKSSDRTPLAAAVAPRPSTNAALADAGTAPLVGFVSNALPPNPTADALAQAQGEFKSQPAPQDQLVLLVSTRNPSQATQQVASYLASNNIPYESVNAPAQQQQQIQTAGLADASAFGKPLKEKDAEAPTTPALAGNAPAQQPLSEDLTVPQDQPAALAKRRSAAAATRDKESLSPTQQQAVQKYFEAIERSANPTNDTQKDAARQQVILARGMTHQQALQLTDTLSTDLPSQRARLISDTNTQQQQQQLPGRKLESSPLTLGTARAESPTAPADLPAGPVIDSTLSLNQLTPATTQSTTAPTTQADASVDVLILVQDEQPTTTTAPSSQPASRP